MYFPHLWQRRMLDKPRMLLQLPGFQAAWFPTWNKSRLNWKLKVSDMAHNAGITQSQAGGKGGILTSVGWQVTL